MTRPSSPWHASRIEASLDNHAKKMCKNTAHLHYKSPIHTFRRKRFLYVNTTASQILSGSFYPSPITYQTSYNGTPSQFIEYTDRIAERFLLDIIRPCSPHIIHPHCFHRFGPSGSRKALSHLYKDLHSQRYHYLLRLDIKSFYASIHHLTLIDLLKQDFNDTRLLDLFERFITRYLYTPKGFSNPDFGLSYRSPLSQFFASIYLKPLDQAFDHMAVSYTRYMDDIVILCRSHNQFKKARAKVFPILQSLKLTLSPKKSYMGPLTDFHYLGAMIKVTPSFDLCNTQISTCLHPRTMLKALNKAKVSAAFGSATHNLRQYLIRWARWWALATQRSALSCLQELLSWSKSNWLSAIVEATILSDPVP